MTTWMRLLPELKTEILLHSLSYKSLGCMLKSVRRIKAINKEAYRTFTDWYTWMRIFKRFGFILKDAAVPTDQFYPISVLFQEEIIEDDLMNFETWRQHRIPDEENALFNGEIPTFATSDYLLQIHEKKLMLYHKSLINASTYFLKLPFGHSSISIRETSIGLMLIVNDEILYLFINKSLIKIAENRERLCHHILRNL